MKPPVPFLVHVQALGGKFLGPNAYNNTAIGIALQYSMGIIPLAYQIKADTDDGNISTSFTTGSTSPFPILTMPDTGTGNPTVNYLTPGPKTIVGKASVFLPDSNETAMLLISIPTASGQGLLFSQPVLLNPQKAGYDIHVIIPGLLLTPNLKVKMPPNTISVFVAMMCGCKIVDKKGTYWHPADFSVSARITYKNGKEDQVNLVFDKNFNESLFSKTVADIADIKQINFSAQQKSTSNYGALLQEF